MSNASNKELDKLVGKIAKMQAQIRDLRRELRERAEQVKSLLADRTKLGTDLASLDAAYQAQKEATKQAKLRYIEECVHARSMERSTKGVQVIVAEQRLALARYKPEPVIVARWVDGFPGGISGQVHFKQAVS